MGDGPIHPIIHLITIDTMLDNNRLNNGQGLKNGTCKQGLRLEVSHWEKV